MRVVYVDLDPVVSTHAAALMASPNVITLNADLRQPEQVLGDAQVGAARLRPARRHHVHLRAALPVERGGPVGDRAAVPDTVVPGSHLAISHMTDEAHPQAAERLFQMTQDLHFSTPLISRPRADVARFFDAFTLVEPGLVAPAQWRPDLHNPLRISGRDGDEGENSCSSEAPSSRPRMIPGSRGTSVGSAPRTDSEIRRISAIDQRPRIGLVHEPAISTATSTYRDLGVGLLVLLASRMDAGVVGEDWRVSGRGPVLFGWPATWLQGARDRRCGLDRCGLGAVEGR
jgi:hypothetical protein